MVDGNRFLFVKDMDNPASPARTIGEGNISVWDKNGQALYAVVESPNRTDLVGYNVADGTLAMPLVHLPTSVNGFDQVVNDGQGWLNSYISSSVSSSPSNSLTPSTDTSNTGVQNVVLLDGIKLPRASVVSSVFLLPFVKESFLALQSDTTTRVGWDFLNTLDNAFLPLTVPPDPGDADAWLYTGRAIEVNSQALPAGWMTIGREDFSGQVYWRVFIKCYVQDGSMGAPIQHLIWDLSARSSGNKQAYEDGGKYAVPPPGYWVDFTDLAQNDDWERIPALSIWRSYYPAIRYNQFAVTGGMNISTSLSQMYPPEALVTFTPVPTSALIIGSTPTVHP
jgi:TolB protein